VPEWLKGSLSKSGVPFMGTGGSNPSLSAKEKSSPARGWSPFG
jgi:hypothetical protein